MKAHLLYRDRDLDLDAEAPPQSEALIQDLGLDTLFAAMAAGDKTIFEVARRVVLRPLDDPDAIAYRQAILRDCLAQPDVATQIYDLIVHTGLAARTVWRGTHRPSAVLSGAVAVLEVYVGALRQLRAITDHHAHRFRSEGFRTLFALLARELDDTYLAEVDDHLRRLRFPSGVLLGARLGTGNEGTGYVLRRRGQVKQTWRERLAAFRARNDHSFQIADRDQAGAQALSDLWGRGINLVANAVAQSADHIASFLLMLQLELAFYLGCVNLHTRLRSIGEPTCIPTAVASGQDVLSASGLYDPCLALVAARPMVGNDLAADGKTLMMVTGANQGGKSTFLRSVGVAQLMLQAGTFVPATSFRANVCAGVFTHFKREEDPTMRHGKLDEELSRMSSLADQITPGSLVLCNESFASTNEREGSELARQVVRALLDAGVKVGYVTHLCDLARSLHDERLATALFLRAERRPDGQRTFRIIEGAPEQTSHGADLYRGRRP